MKENQFSKYFVLNDFEVKTLKKEKLDFFYSIYEGYRKSLNELKEELDCNVSFLEIFSLTLSWRQKDVPEHPEAGERTELKYRKDT